MISNNRSETISTQQGRRSSRPCKTFSRIAASLITAFLVVGCSSPTPDPHRPYHDSDGQMLPFEEALPRIEANLITDYQIITMDVPQLEDVSREVLSFTVVTQEGLSEDAWMQRFGNQDVDQANVRVLTEDQQRYEYEIALVHNRPTLFNKSSNDSGKPDPQELLRTEGE